MSEAMEFVKRVAEHVGYREDKFYKTTLFRSEALLLGLNCLEAGQVQKVHAHAGQDKFYYVISGSGRFVLGEELFAAGPGEVIWAPADVAHGVTNENDERLILLVGIAPAP